MAHQKAISLDPNILIKTVAEKMQFVRKLMTKKYDWKPSS
jgi:hypothetical protein